MLGDGSKGLIQRIFNDYSPDASADFIDNLQAIIVDEKLKHIDSWNAMRNNVVDKYNLGINNSNILLPKKATYCNYHVYHIYDYPWRIYDKTCSCVRVLSAQTYIRTHTVIMFVHHTILRKRHTILST